MKKQTKKQTKQQNSVAEIAARAWVVMKQLEEMKPLYNELEQLTLALKQSGLSVFDLGQISGEQINLIIVDNFAGDKNTVFKTTAVKRYELKVA